MFRLSFRAASFVLGTLAAAGLFLTSAGCRSRADVSTETRSQSVSVPEPGRQPAETVVDDEENASVETSADLSPKEQLPKVRKAARDYVREKYPNSRVEGVFTLGFRGSLYLAGVDVAMGEQNRQTVDLIVRLYMRRNGSGYWRAEGIDSRSAARLMEEAVGDAAGEREEGQ